MRLPAGLGFVAGLILIFSVAGCSKKSGVAVVLEKEHIAAREIPPTPPPQQSTSPSAPTPEPAEVVWEEVETRELAEDEIAVDTYVMKKVDRGTSRDPRARDDEQWIVEVQLVDGGRRFNVHTDRLSGKSSRSGIASTSRIAKGSIRERFGALRLSSGKAKEDMGYDVAVVGLGGMGSAILAHCAARGASAIGIEQFQPAHDLGASHGKTPNDPQGLLRRSGVCAVGAPSL